MNSVHTYDHSATGINADIITVWYYQWYLPLLMLAFDSINNLLTWSRGLLVLRKILAFNF